ncbi:hypothetical protein [Nocardia amamiensis]|uniref:hypothetical protein n=1 Tax=Nocardia amamiensis TaxID=404578 RepID=UPI00082B82F5|nr:hypothetical protein [Nocardia amamiensis]
MGFRAVSVLGLALLGAGVGAAVMAGSAGAVTPVGDPANGIVAGLGFNHGETEALANSPIPGVLGIGLVAPAVVVHVPEESALQREDGKVLADMPTVWRDAAGAPTGKIAVALLDPAKWHGKTILVAEFR